MLSASPSTHFLGLVGGLAALDLLGWRRKRRLRLSPRSRRASDTIKALGNVRLFLARANLLECPLLAHSRHWRVRRTCPLLGVKQTCRFALHMSAFDPKRTLLSPSNIPI